ncbi:MAG: type III-B CRISPR module-associated protein Cmr3 [Thiothrix lacustris]|uniref:Type III-B CRISPR module-associated protein Cmr3 n=1 Tax=Thiothrix lacustris TaxID=525917 RepID=A0A1Y1QW16_9GAMM|nr:MAG: type III-B CRISPR module-associated protein Cmr3 [Thiothrix lacustris]
MSKNKGKPQKKHIHYGKGTPAVKSVTPASPKSTEELQRIEPINFKEQVTLVFNATDTLFFRESRPMEALGEAQSVFPPPVRTLAGAVRTLIGEHLGVNWHDFNENHVHFTDIGHGEKLGNLRFEGAWLAWNGKRLYPAPLHLMRKEGKLFQLTLDKDTVHCDLGKNVRLPKLPDRKLPDGDEPKGSKPLENAWLTHAGLEAVLQGKSPLNYICDAKALFASESRLGIARDNASRSVQKGMLYQTQHIRPKAELSIELDTHGLPDGFTTPSTLVRLGGEGRTASIGIKQTTNILPKADKIGKTFAIYLLTPLYGSPCLDFERDKNSNPTVWKGTLNGVALTLHGAITGKVQRVGGWDMAANKPRPVKSLVPAGSVFFCSVDNDDDVTAAIDALHNKRIGNFTEYGYGHLAIGVWNDNDTQGNKA